MLSQIPIKLRNHLQPTKRWSIAIYASILILGIPPTISSQEQNPSEPTLTGERKSDNDQVRLQEKEIISKPVKFLNQTRKRAEPILAQGNVQLGILLAKKRENFPNRKVISASGIRIHRILPDNKNNSTLLGADILTIDPSVTITHINVLHRILSGYIRKMFSYNKEQSRFLAYYVLYYNALRYKNTDYLTTRYLPKVKQVLANMPPGIPIQSKNWPGNTALLMPLWRSTVYNASGDLVRAELNRTVRENENLKKEGKIDDDAFRKLDQNRKKKHTKKLQDKNAHLNDAKGKLNKKQEKIQEDKQRTLQEKKEAEQNLAQTKESPNPDPEDVKNLENKKKQLGEEINRLDSEEQKNAQSAKDLEKEQKAVSNEAQRIAGRSQPNPNNADQKNPAKSSGQSQDPKESGGIIGPQGKNEPAPILSNGNQLLMEVYRPTEKGHYQNKLYFFDPNKEKKKKESNYKNICSRTYFIIEKVGVLVTGYMGEHDDPENQQSHNLVLLHQRSLRKIRENSINVYWKTPLYFKKKHIYVFTYPENKEFFLARFSTKLQQVSQSSIPVNPESTLRFEEESNRVIVSEPADALGNQKQITFRMDTLVLVETRISASFLDKKAND